MLKINKNITLTGYATIQNSNVVYLNATLSSDGNTNEVITKNIINEELYNAHKLDIRQQMRDFDDMVYAEQDKLDAVEVSTKKGGK